MAVEKAVAKKKAARIGFNPDSMASAGLPDDFNGTITDAVYCPFDYDGKLDHDILAVRLTIRPDADSGYDEIVQHYSVGNLDDFVPSPDGDEPVDLEADDKADMEGPFVVAVGTRTALNKSSNFAQWVTVARDGGLDPELMDAGDLSALVGTYGHWSRIPQQKRSGIRVRVEEEESDKPKREAQILVLDEIKEAPKAGKKGSAAPPAKAKKDAVKAVPKGKKAAAEEEEEEVEEEEEEEGEEENELDAAITKAIVKALKAAPGNKLSKGKLPKVIMAAFSDPAEKKAAMKRAGSVEFLENEDQDKFAYDPDDGELTLA